MNNTAEIFEAHFPRITKTKVVLEYGAPIYPDQLPKEDQKKLGQYVQRQILEMMKKNQKLISEV